MFGQNRGIKSENANNLSKNCDSDRPRPQLQNVLDSTVKMDKKVYTNCIDHETKMEELNENEELIERGDPFSDGVLCQLRDRIQLEF